LIQRFICKHLNRNSGEKTDKNSLSDKKKRTLYKQEPSFPTI
jgi:hypothetical protein